MKKIIILLTLALLTFISSCGKKYDEVITPTIKPTDIVTEAPTVESSASETVSGIIYIINGSSTDLYGIYLSENTEGNPGENIIGGSVLGEGEEIEFSFADITQNALYITIEDADGNQISSNEPLTIKDGLIIELRLTNGELEIIAA